MMSCVASCAMCFAYCFGRQRRRLQLIDMVTCRHHSAQFLEQQLEIKSSMSLQQRAVLCRACCTFRGTLPCCRVGASTVYQHEQLCMLHQVFVLCLASAPTQQWLPPHTCCNGNVKPKYSVVAVQTQLVGRVPVVLLQSFKLSLAVLHTQCASQVPTEQSRIC